MTSKLAKTALLFVLLLLLMACSLESWWIGVVDSAIATSQAEETAFVDDLRATVGAEQFHLQLTAQAEQAP